MKQQPRITRRMKEADEPEEPEDKRAFYLKIGGLILVIIGLIGWANSVWRFLW